MGREGSVRDDHVPKIKKSARVLSVLYRVLIVKEEGEHQLYAVKLNTFCIQICMD